MPQDLLPKLHGSCTLYLTEKVQQNFLRDFKLIYFSQNLSIEDACYNVALEGKTTLFVDEVNAS